LALLTLIAAHEIPELIRLASTLDAWREELLAYFDTGGVSNGPAEATNALIKKGKRLGHGYRGCNPGGPARARRHARIPR
jgi:transposase